MNYTIDSQTMGLIAAWARRLAMPVRIDKTDIRLCANALEDVLRDAIAENGKTWKENAKIGGAKSEEGSS